MFNIHIMLAQTSARLHTHTHTHTPCTGAKVSLQQNPITVTDWGSLRAQIPPLPFGANSPLSIAQHIICETYVRILHKYPECLRCVKLSHMCKCAFAVIMLLAATTLPEWSITAICIQATSHQPRPHSSTTNMRWMSPKLRAGARLPHRVHKFK